MCMYNSFITEVSLPQIINTIKPTTTDCLSWVIVQYDKRKISSFLKDILLFFNIFFVNFLPSQKLTSLTISKFFPGNLLEFFLTGTTPIKKSFFILIIFSNLYLLELPL